MVLIDGIVAGVWHQRRSDWWIDKTVQTFGKPTAAQLTELDVRWRGSRGFWKATPADAAR